MTDFEKRCMVQRKRRFLLTECAGPFVGNCGEMRIGSGANAVDQLREWLRKIFVVPETETVAFHNDVAAETSWIVVKGDNGGAFFPSQNWIGYCITAAGERFARGAPVEGVDSFLNCGTHDGSFSSLEWSWKRNLS